MKPSTLPARNEDAGEKSGVENNINQTNQHITALRLPCPMLPSESLLVPNGACQPTNTTAGSVVPSKKEAFHARRTAQRKDPANCGRCGNPSPVRYCEKCQASQRRRADIKAARAVEMQQSEKDALLRRICSLENAVANLQLAAMKDRKNIYRTGYLAGQKGERKARFTDPEEISFQEAQAISHEFQKRN